MKKLNNKGFSIVELIVVIAIMAILAVTLAPRLTQYVEKARQVSDQEAVNTIFTAAKLANLEAPLGKDLSIDFGAATAGKLYTISDNGKTWKITTLFAPADETTEGTKEFYNILLEILGNFKLKSANVGDDTSIKLTTDATSGKITVTLQYGTKTYDAADANTGYQVTE